MSSHNWRNYRPTNRSAVSRGNNLANTQPQHPIVYVYSPEQPVVAIQYSNALNYPVCIKCGTFIDDETYLRFAKQIYHKCCLRCSFCKKLLRRDEHCYMKAGSPICSFDYERYVANRCARCRKILSMDSWVRKVHDRFYHVSCFSCDSCQRILQEHDQYTIVKTKVYCRPGCSPCQIKPGSDGIDVTGSFCDDAVQQSSENSSSTGIFTDFFDTTESNNWDNGLTVSGASVVTTDNPSEWRFCARDRPRSSHLIPSAALGSNDENVLNKDLLHEHRPLKAPTFTQLRFRSQQAFIPGQRYCTPNQSVLFDRYPGLTEINGPMVRCDVRQSGSPSMEKQVRRIRTNFSDEQMLILQSSFDNEPNPGTQDLESIANATGLSKRVTQVWFQNCRARIRRARENRQIDSSLSAEVSGQSRCSSLDTSSTREAATPVMQSLVSFPTQKDVGSVGGCLENELQIENMDPETTSYTVNHKSTIDDK